MKYRTRFHLLLGRGDAKNPRWVIAKEYAAKPADIPADYTVPAGRTFLREVASREFDWMRQVFGRDTHVTVIQPGRESYSTRIAHPGDVWTEHRVPVCRVADHDHDDPNRVYPGIPAWGEWDEWDDPDRWTDEVDDD